MHRLRLRLSKMPVVKELRMHFRLFELHWQHRIRCLFLQDQLGDLHEGGAVMPPRPVLARGDTVIVTENDSDDRKISV